MLCISHITWCVTSECLVLWTVNTWMLHLCEMIFACDIKACLLLRHFTGVKALWKFEWRSFYPYEALEELKCLWRCLAWPNFILGKQSQSECPVSTLSITCKNNQLMTTCHILSLRPVLEHSYWINEVARYLWLIFYDAARSESISMTNSWGRGKWPPALSITDCHRPFTPLHC